MSWFSYWDSHDVDRRYEFNSVEYTLGLLTNEGRVKEQGHMFRELATSYGGKPVRFPTASLPSPPQEPNDGEYLALAARLDGLAAASRKALRTPGG